MRISTSQIIDSGALNIQNSQSSLYKMQNQLSTGRRVLTPQDDPVAAAQALVVSQSISVNEQHTTNQGQAKNQLGLVDSQLTSLEGVLQNIRERVVQAGSTTLSFSDRAAIASELESRLSEMIGIANSDNGSGEYLFSGYSGNVRPFAVDGSTPVAPATVSPVSYYGDEGERLLQVSSSRQMAVSVAGSSVFMDAKNGNGTFVTGTGGVRLLPAAAPQSPAVNNLGTARVDAGSVSDPGKWNVAGNPGNFMVRFSVTTSAGGIPTTTYQLYDNTNPAAPVALLAAEKSFTPGQSISLVDEINSAPSVIDYGASMTVQGQPSDGDSFTVTPSTSQSLFQTVQNLIGILRSSVGGATYSTTQYANDLAAQLTNVDRGLDNVGTVLASVGTRMQEIESLGSTSSDLDIQYKASLSDLQDLDYVKAISDFIKQQTSLEASQKAFAKVSDLSLFKYL